MQWKGNNIAFLFCVNAFEIYELHFVKLIFELSQVLPWISRPVVEALPSNTPSAPSFPDPGVLVSTVPSSSPIPAVSTSAALGFPRNSVAFSSMESSLRLPSWEHSVYAPPLTIHRQILHPPYFTHTIYFPNFRNFCTNLTTSEEILPNAASYFLPKAFLTKYCLGKNWGWRGGWAGGRTDSLSFRRFSSNLVIFKWFLAKISRFLAKISQFLEKFSVGWNLPPMAPEPRPPQNHNSFTDYARSSTQFSSFVPTGHIFHKKKFL